MANCSTCTIFPKNLETTRYCTQKNVTKAALFVIAFLLAGGAFGAYAYGLGVTGVVAFATASALSCIAALLLHCAVPSQAPLILEEKTGLELVEALPDPAKGNSKEFKAISKELKHQIAKLWIDYKCDDKLFAWAVSSYFYKAQGFPYKQEALISIILGLDIDESIKREILEATNMYDEAFKESVLGRIKQI